MRHPILLAACIAGVSVVSGCGDKSGADTVSRAVQDVNVIDESNLNDVMLTVADPDEAVNYFSRTATANPDRIDVQRGLGTSLVRAKRNQEAAAAWSKVIKKEWEKADSFYEIAIGLTTKPGSVMNNWGYSKLSRGDYKGAERLFGEAIQQEPALFTAKNNLVLARGAQGEYTLPPIAMDQSERAQLLHTLALSAIKKGDVETGKGLLRDAISTHPQHFEAAVRSLRALEDAG